MKTKLLLILFLSFISVLNAQNIGIGTTSPTNSLHIVPTGSIEPIRIEGVKAFVSEQNLLIIDPTTGVIRHIHIDSLDNRLNHTIDTDVDSVRYLGDSLYIYENGQVVSTYLNTALDSTAVNNLIYAKTDSFYTYISDSLSRDSAWLSLIDSDVDSVRYLGDSLYIYENGQVVSTYLNTALDSTAVNNLIYAKTDSFYTYISDSLSRDSAWLSLIDSDVDSVRYLGDSLYIYENGKVVSTYLNTEWIAGSNIGLFPNTIYSKRAFLNGDTVVITESGRMGLNTSTPKDFIDVKGSISNSLVGATGFTIELDTSYSGGWVRGLESRLNGIRRGYIGFHGSNKNLTKTFMSADYQRAGYLAPDFTILSSNGNVGIGTPNPTASMQIRIDNNITKELKGIFSLESIQSNGQKSFLNFYNLAKFNSTASALIYDTTVSTLSVKNVSNTKGIAFATSSTERMRITSNGDIGIKTSNPRTDIELAGSLCNLLIDPDTLVYGYGIEIDTSLSSNWARGLSNIISNTRRGLFGFYGDTITPIYTYITGDNIRSNYTNPDFRILASNGYVGINTGVANPSEQLEVVGNFKLNGDFLGSGINSYTSDERFKKNIAPLNNSLEKIMRIKGYSYHMRKDLKEFAEYNFSDKKRYGVLAQEIKKEFPELVSEDKNGYYSVNYDGLIPVLIEAIKEQQLEIEYLKKMIYK